MKTEAEARKLWCPMVRTGEPPTNTAARCIASRCMMWEWDKNVMFFPETNSLRMASVLDG